MCVARQPGPHPLARADRADVHGGLRLKRGEGALHPRAAREVSVEERDEREVRRGVCE